MRALRHITRKPLAAGLASVAAAALVGACAYNEALGRQQIVLVGDDALAQAGASAWQQTLSTQRVSNDATLNRRVNEVGRRIVGAAGLGGQQWEYRVFENNSPNAFVLPGGRVGVTTGLFRVAQNDDQLAAVIGHEVAHTTARHAAERYSQQALAQVGLSVAGQAVQSRAALQALGLGAQVGALLPFSRQHELEADRIGVDYMAQAGYRPSEAVALWRNMGAARSGGTPQFLSTHPNDATRIQQLEAYIRSRGYS
ncbi:MAG TPA: M48 family metallopeptidase [Caulobacteraceae bacterium]|jgi:predicted Zn-dependent protease